MVNVIDAKQAREWLLNGEAILMDVREPDEFKEQHIAQAQSVPMSLIQSSDYTLEYPKGLKIITQCLKGKRGQTCCALLQERHGKDAFYNIEGGIESWEAEGFPVIRAKSPKLSIFRQVQIGVGSLVAMMVFLGYAGFTPGFAIAGLFGGALLFAGVTGWCGLAMVLQKMPWNKA